MNQKDYKEIARIIKGSKQSYPMSYGTIKCIIADRFIEKLVDYFEREEKKTHWVFCDSCADKGLDARIAVDKKTIFSIDCDCGAIIEGFNKKQFLKDCGIDGSGSQPPKEELKNIKDKEIKEIVSDNPVDEDMECKADIIRKYKNGSMDDKIE